MIGWSMSNKMTKRLVIDALLMEIWHRKLSVCTIISLPLHFF